MPTPGASPDALRPKREEVMRKLLSLVSIVLVAGACSAGDPSNAPAASGTVGPAARYSVQTGSNNLILRMANEGGFVAPGYLLTATPQFALYGDGTIIVPGPVVQMYPGPLLPNLRLLQVTPDEIQKLLAAADADGLLGPDASYDATNVADAGTTVFTTTVNGATHVISAYALMAEAVSGNPTVTAARNKLLDFQAKLENLGGFLGHSPPDAGTYDAKALRVFTSPASAAGQAGVRPQVVTWPLVQDPATAGKSTTASDTRCIAISGADLASFLSVAQTANATTIWTAPSGRYNVSVRPLYPDESGC